ncbi:MAG: hypothetical protein FVQ80_01980 [Planctomycetes bacterium]|nr:hypothetical protein [Planctomycetota bacterium]
MAKKLVTIGMILILAGLAVSVPQYPKVLRDGFAFSGVDGKLIAGDNDRWFFKLDSDISDDQTTVKAGTELELLVSSALEKVITDIKKDSADTYRIWGKVTAYDEKNYVFGIYFLPFTEVKQSQTTRKDKKRKAEIINDPNDALTIPKELAEKLATRKIIRTEELKKGLEIKADSILANRTGFLSLDKDGDTVFVLDGLGRNIPKISIKLLPCNFLQTAEIKQTAALEKLRFKIAGIVTKYKNENYLLLHRIQTIYSFGNFPQ